MCKKINIFAPCLFAFYLLSSLLVGILTSAFGVKLPLWLSLIVSQTLLLIPAIVYVAVMKINIIKCIPYRKIKPLDALISLLIGYCLIPMILLINVVSSFFSTNYLNESQGEISSYPFIIQLLLMAVLPIIAEEFVFRGLFYHSYRKNGILGAAVLSGCVFGAIHLNINQCCYAMVMGAVLALMVEATGSMFSSMIAHFAVNSYSIIMLKIVSSLNVSPADTSQAAAAFTEYPLMVKLVQIIILLIVSAMFMTVAFLLFMAMAKRNGRWEYMKRNIKKGFKAQNNEKFVTIPLAATFVASLVFMIIQEL